MATSKPVLTKFSMLPNGSPSPMIAAIKKSEISLADNNSKATATRPKNILAQRTPFQSQKAETKRVGGITSHAIRRAT